MLYIYLYIFIGTLDSSSMLFIGIDINLTPSFSLRASKDAFSPILISALALEGHP